MYVGPFKKSPIHHNRRLFVIHVLTETLDSHTIPVYINRKLAYIIMRKFVGICVQLAIDISVLNHGKQQAFGEGAHHCIVYGPGYRSVSKCKS